MCTKKYFIAKNGTSPSVGWVRDHMLDFLDVPLSKAVGYVFVGRKGRCECSTFCLLLHH